MSELVNKDALVDMSLQELQELAPHDELEILLGRTALTKELQDIYSSLIPQYGAGDVPAFVSVYDRVATLLDRALRTAEHRRLIAEILIFAYIVFDFVLSALKLEQLRNPTAHHPTHEFLRQYLMNLIHRCLESPYSSDIQMMLERLEERVEADGEIAYQLLHSETDTIIARWDHHRNSEASDETEEEDDDDDDDSNSVQDAVSERSSSPAASPSDDDFPFLLSQIVKRGRRAATYLRSRLVV